MAPADAKRGVVHRDPVLSVAVRDYLRVVVPEDAGGRLARRPGIERARVDPEGAVVDERQPKAALRLHVQAHVRLLPLIVRETSGVRPARDRKSTRLNSSHSQISYAG